MEMTNSAVFYLMLAGQAPASEPQPFWVSMVPFALIMVIFYFLLIRPQAKKAKEHAALVKSIKPGDKVTTNGGIMGVVVTVKDNTVSLRSSDSKLEILKSAVAEINERASR
jgi:preprotein translocase subunit YajC